MKRFIETNRFAEKWYFDMPPEMKCAWEYIWSNCDNAGVWNVNTKLAEMQIGKRVDWQDFIVRCEGRVVELPKDRWFLPAFVPFQCGVLSANSRPHMAVAGLLRQHGLMPSDSLSIEYPRTIHSPKEKEQDKDKDQDQDKEQDARAQKNRGTQLEVSALCAELKLPDNDAVWFFQKCEGNGWSNGGKPIKDWRSTVRSWQAAGYFPSQKRNGSGVPPSRQAEADGRLYPGPAIKTIIKSKDLL